MYVCVGVGVYVCMYVCMYVYMYVCTVAMNGQTIVHLELKANLGLKLFLEVIWNFLSPESQWSIVSSCIF